MPRNLGTSAFMKPLVVLALPGMYLFYKYSQYKRQQQEQNRRRVTERELAHLNHKIDKLLTKLEENEPEIATSQEDECVICVNAKATMQTSPCGHRVVCRKCFVKTIQMAVSQRLLPLRCVICRAKILRLKQSVRLPSSLLSKDAAAVAGGSSSSRSSSSSSSWLVNSASRYSMGPVPNSESLYSMSSGSSSLSGVSSSSGSSTGSAGIRNYPRQPTGALKISQTHSMKYHLQEYKEPRTHSSTQVSSINGGGLSSGSGPEKRLPPIQEFQRDFRLGRDRSTSTRIRCAQKIVTQLEIGPVITATTSNTIKISTSSSSGFFRGGGKTGGVSGSDLSSGEKKRFGSASQSKEPAPQIKKDAKGDSKTPYTRLLEEKDKETEPTKDGRKIEKTEKTTKGDKKEKNKEKELTKAEKKEQKKEAKAEKKAAKKEAKNDKKKE